MLSGKSLAVPLLGIVLSACASAPEYTCDLPPDAGRCASVSDVYAESVSGTLKTKPDEKDAESKPAQATPVNMAASAATAPRPAPVIATVHPGDPILTSPRILRVWIAPWEDRSGTLHDETFLYLRLDAGRWRLGR